MICSDLVSSRPDSRWPPFILLLADSGSWTEMISHDSNERNNVHPYLDRFSLQSHHIILPRSCHPIPPLTIPTNAPITPPIATPP